MVRVLGVNHDAAMRNIVGIRCKTIHELGGTMPENLPASESIKKIESREKKRLMAG